MKLVTVKEGASVGSGGSIKYLNLGDDQARADEEQGNGESPDDPLAADAI